MKYFKLLILTVFVSCNVQLPESLTSELPKISEGGITTIPKIPGNFNRAKYLVEDQYFVKRCSFLGEFYGKGYYEVIEIDFDGASQLYRQMYSISEDYLGLRDGSCNHSLLSNKFSIVTEFDYSFVNTTSFDGVLLLEERFRNSLAIVGDTSVLPVLSSIFLRDGKMICNTNWATQA